MNKRYLLIGGIIAAAMTLSFIVGSVVRAWPGTSDPLKAALINGSIAIERGGVVEGS
jgi:hypothetical protein